MPGHAQVSHPLLVSPCLIVPIFCDILAAIKPNSRHTDYKWLALCVLDYKGLSVRLLAHAIKADRYLETGSKE
ncbi:hypothetical protein LZ32DRAFT_608149 [Colletotrichum eremochloae]|nr:hypothetical protein LZ32DRAFT_608149 [Colletotrichum eremochloae]